MEADPVLVDLIYEAAAVPELWPAVLARLGSLSTSWGVGLLAFDARRNVIFTSTSEYRPHLESYAKVADKYPNPRPQRFLATGHAGFVADLEMFTQVELDQDILYRDWLYPIGIHWTAGTVIPVPSDEILVFDFARAERVGPFERETMAALDPYRPHLARAALLAHRLGLQAARNATDALQTIGLPAAALTSGGRLLVANSLFESLAPGIQIGAFDRVSFSDRSADSLLARLIDGKIESIGATPLSIPIPATEESPALIVHLLPVRLAAQDIFARAGLMLVVTAVVAPDAPLTELLHGLFDLTPAESRVARGVANGLSVAEIASISSASRETIRTQLKAVMAKTATNRQIELSRLLAGAQPLRPFPFARK